MSENNTPSIGAVTLPAGSYDFDKLNESLTAAPSIEKPEEREAAIASAVDEARTGGAKEQDPRHIEGDKFVKRTRTIGDEKVTETVQVYDAKAAEEARAEQESTSMAGEAVRDRSSSDTQAGGTAPRSANKEK